MNYFYSTLNLPGYKNLLSNINHWQTGGDREEDEFIKQFKQQHSYTDYSLLYNFLKTQVNTTLDNFEIKISSGESVILIFPNVVVKLFTQNTDVQKEKLISDQLQPNVIKVLQISDQPKLKAIVYQKVVPITTEQLKKMSKLELLNFMKGVAKTLKNIHLKGYLHGDVGHTNIGYDTVTGQYVLMDLEDMKQLTIEQQAFEDVKQFLEDLQVQIKEPWLEQFIQELFKKWKQTVMTTVTFLGKERQRLSSVIVYQIGDFSQALENQL